MGVDIDSGKVGVVTDPTGRADRASFFPGGVLQELPHELAFGRRVIQSPDPLKEGVERSVVADRVEQAVQAQIFVRGARVKEECALLGQVFHHDLGN